MTLTACPQGSNWIRVGAAGGVCAVTMLWVGGTSSALFQVGTVLLVLSLIPLARGLGARGGSMVGLLLGVVWVAARLGMNQPLNVSTLFTELNVTVLVALMTIGGLSGALFGASQDAEGENGRSEGGSTLVPMSAGHREGSPSGHDAHALMARALTRHREWVANWDQAGNPWVSFDRHVRELVRMMTGLRRLRCYRIGNEGQLYPLSTEVKDEITSPSRDLLTHVVTTGRRYLIDTPSAGPLVEELAKKGETQLAWAMPIRDRNVTVGLMTAEGLPEEPLGSAYLEMVGDLVEELWLHVCHLEALRRARQTDRGSGLINRTDLLPALRSTLEQCQKLHEPVVVVIVCLEGLRGLDDASQWSKRDELIERVGSTIAAGIRKDDLVGRFSDAQFVALLRRLDTPLAELICRKLLSSIARVICDFELTTWVTPRAGLSGSAFGKVSVETLLTHAMSALNSARTQDMLLVSEQPEKSKVEVQA